MFFLATRDGKQLAMVARTACNARRVMRLAQPCVLMPAAVSSRARIAFSPLQSCAATVRSCPRTHRARSG
ncbi:hypothetical protein DEG02_015705 [Xanthomonas vasicola]|uniref:Uncharacterized protein n=1 Tax=Xanthomonas vasicola TaxID=56459 RepID=A0ABD7S8I0_XANVA|nr:hypothetical protein NX81_023060 [Xanthomonas vasicola]AZR32749.1 hypothetical protein KWO_021935 [Xanthomonas vasicola pv. musacearum NCPPB 4379]RNK82070.1 hypothetical protein C9390_02845 [Xanthomonas vasicola pv. vasculorum]RRJ39717.1 hypothetical protein EIM46_12060 [Xanthomonas vasicola pv. musacearum]AZR36779.1 hypothetical protein NX08_022600 [Xanthomonas vasicola]